MRKFIGFVVAMGLVVSALPLLVGAEVERSARHSFNVEIISEGLNRPWGLAFLPDGRMLISERPGRLLLLDPERNERWEVEGTPEVAATNQGGLLDVALHPEFESNGWVYLSYAKAGDGGYTTAVGRGQLQDARLSGFQELFVATPYASGGRHFGSRLVFDEQGYLFISTGDRGLRDNAQALDSHHGKIIRLTDDGQIPADNPFLDHAEALPGIYSYGHRNPQGMILHPDTGDVWLNEHGPRGGDEINRVQAGLNFGWPKVTHGREYHGPSIGPSEMEGMEPPLHHWTPSIAPSGMAYYQGERFPDWQGNIFVGALAGRHLARLTVDGTEIVDEEQLLADRQWRVRDVRAGPDGYIYLLVDATDAPLVRLTPADQ
ncbi:MAG: PQQ-dependent sugar dehydrogenase [Ectothiorhodospiraceae bacterium]|nr:PQQ-dependent sugar dehydrogenase [Ectothiorhodospiraceae bacterium]MCH8504587.1 PQQ-dependent sugar dehydrogenase [Ectothiorhodospiraceae bacterium]